MTLSRALQQGNYTNCSALLHFAHQIFAMQVAIVLALTNSNEDNAMPLINVKLIQNVFTPEQKAEMASKLTDAMVSIEGEALRRVTWVVIEEVQESHWSIGGEALQSDDVRRMQAAG